jgi:hypothetical protein
MNERDTIAPWPVEHLGNDFINAIGGDVDSPAIYTTAGVGAPEAAPIRPDDVAEVTDWFASYHEGGPYVVGSGDTGTELDLVAILRLKDGRWASVQAWNDYEGWGCQDGTKVAIGDTKEQVVMFGLDEEGRRKLGLEAADHG